MSASPEFLIKEFANRLGVSCVASQVDFKTGRYSRSSCRGIEKVVQFLEKYPEIIVEESYGNAKSDIPIIACGKKGYMVTNYSKSAVKIEQVI